MKQKAKKVELPSGTLFYAGPKKKDETIIEIIEYDGIQYKEKHTKNRKEIFRKEIEHGVKWININEVHDAELLEEIGKKFNLHPLLLEDITNIKQSSKLEDFEDYVFIVIKVLRFNKKKRRIDIEQISFVLREDLVISFQEKKGDLFNPVREDIKNAKGRIRKMGADYLLYSLIDEIIYNYFVLMEEIEYEIEHIEEKLIKNPTQKVLHGIYNLKKNMLSLRKSIWPLREVINKLEKIDGPLINKITFLYIRDLYDHVIHIIDTIETFRDTISSMLDIYLSSLSNKMNEVMKFLTIVSTIFIPMTLITGIYGMNFKYMPELSWKFAYPLSLLGMISIGIGMIVYFKKKKWL